MRKVDPVDVKAGFAAFTTERMALFARLETLLRGTAHEKRDLSVLSETMLHSAYVAFEVFLSDLMLAYINRDFSVYQANLKSRIESSVSGKFGAGAAARTTFTVSKHINIQDLENLIDPTGWNMTFKDVAELKAKFADWILAAHGAGVAALNPSDTRLIDTARAIRNFIAHGSSGSKRIMNDKLVTISTGPACPNLSLPRGNHKIDDVGAYLKAFSGGQRRLLTFIMRLQAIAAGL
ncbi:hypothetical protein [Paraburkholderia nemoris]|uniref:hypothetical protein n=1 Tax=Paraburkholderia nemoris TaxID=2793076 RepID=UPI001B083BDB|nr:hypothetical protein [Paraburkholderia nemoris]CAE6724607.1 hypothetical protein LMG22931_01896 [Paraburkholderia nemoris]